MRTKHVALHVPDLEQAEAYYCRIFDLEVVTREALRGNDLTENQGWAQLPHDADWDDARTAGIDIRMVGLRRDDLLLALFPGTPGPGSLFLVALVATTEEIAAVRARLPQDATVEVDEPQELTFVDLFGFRWQLCGPGFAGPGDARGAWLDLSAGSGAA